MKEILVLGGARRGWRRLLRPPRPAAAGCVSPCWNKTPRRAKSCWPPATAAATSTIWPAGAGAVFYRRTPGPGQSAGRHRRRGPARLVGGAGPCPPGRRDRPALSLLQPGVGPDRPAGGLAGRAGRVRAHRLPRDGHGPKRTRLRRPGRAGGQAHPSGGRQSDLCFGGQRRAAVRHRRLWPRHGQTGWRQGRAAVPLPDPAAAAKKPNS